MPKRYILNGLEVCDAIHDPGFLWVFGVFPACHIVTCLWDAAIGFVPWIQEEAFTAGRSGRKNLGVFHLVLFLSVWHKVHLSRICIFIFYFYHANKTQCIFSLDEAVFIRYGLLMCVYVIQNLASPHQTSQVWCESRSSFSLHCGMWLRNY